MFPEELREYIIHGKEETHIEYKDSMKWPRKPKNNKDKIVVFKIIKAMLAMANHTNGGVIVIGAKEKANGEFNPIGMSKVNSDSFKYDDISRYVKGRSSAPIHFKIDRDTMLIRDKERRFVIIQVAETTEIPIICIKSEKYDEAKPFLGDNIALRENAIYVRSKSPIESREISSVDEWKDLINRTMEKNRKEQLKKMPCYEFIQDKEKKQELSAQRKNETSPVFQKQLKRDAL